MFLPGSNHSSNQFRYDNLLLLGLPLLLAQGPSTNINVHVLVDLDSNGTEGTRDRLNEPQHDCMAPPRCVGIGGKLVSPSPNFVQRSPNEVAGGGDQKAGAANFAHGGRDKMANDELNVNAIIGKLRGQGAAPVLEKSLAAGVCGEIRCRRPASGRAHRQDEALLALLHDRRNNPGHLERAQLVACGIQERDRHVMALANIVQQNGNFKAGDELAQCVVVGVVIAREVHREDLDLCVGMLALDFGGEGVELGLRTGDENEVVALGSKLNCIFFA
jgi:hypothetical protein